MQFHEFFDGYSIAKRMGIVPKDIARSAFYNNMAEAAYVKKNAFITRQAILERDWCDANKPYYNVWPAVFDMISKIKLSIPCSAVKLPEPNKVFCLRLPHPNPYKFDGGEIKTILFSNQKVSDKIGSRNMIDGLCIMIDVGEKTKDGTYSINGSESDLPIYTFKFFPWLSDSTIEEAANVLPYHESWQDGVVIPHNIIVQAIKLAVVTCMIYDDPDIVTPDVLARDRVKYDEALKAEDTNKIGAILDRARRRGKNAFDIGRAVDAMPHFRRPHMALFWTGPGRTVAKIQLRKGSIVHRDKIVNVPTDYLE